MTSLKKYWSMPAVLVIKEPRRYFLNLDYDNDKVSTFIYILMVPVLVVQEVQSACFIP
jgi:hypothetical protein